MVLLNFPKEELTFDIPKIDLNRRRWISYTREKEKRKGYSSKESQPLHFVLWGREPDLSHRATALLTPRKLLKILKAHREPLFPMVVRISLPLPLDDYDTLVVFGLLDKVWDFASISKHLHAMHLPQQLSPMKNWRK
ncbi:hypothetical protein CR513_17245, partial [Mucuna pruriens]